MTLEDRLVRLERQNRWMKGAAVVAVGLFVTLGQSKPQDEVRARKFTLVDEKGETKGSFGLGENGAQLDFYGKGVLNFYEKGVLKFYEKGDVRTILSSGKMVLVQDQGHSLVLTDEPTLGLINKEYGSIVLSIDEGAIPMIKGADGAGAMGPWLFIKSKSGMASMNVMPTRGGGVKLDSVSGLANRAELTTFKNGAGFLLQGEAGSVLISTNPESGPKVMMVDSEKMLFEAP